METLYVQAVKGTQSLNYTEYLAYSGTRWKVHFRHDFYEQQSTGVASRWDGSKWQDVFHCEPSRLKLGGHSTIEAVEFWQDDAALDAQYMVNMAAMVIGEAAA